jgi:uncharacterized protein YciI
MSSGTGRVASTLGLGPSTAGCANGLCDCGKARGPGGCAWINCGYETLRGEKRFARKPKAAHTRGVGGGDLEEKVVWLRNARGSGWMVVRGRLDERWTTAAAGRAVPNWLKEYGLAAPLSSVAGSVQSAAVQSEGSSAMWYAIEGHDVPDSLGLRQPARPAHLSRLQALLDAGRLLLAGPCPAIDSPDPGPAGFSGSIVIAEFDSLEAARAWADADPYMLAGAYARVDVRPFVKVLP